MKALVFSLFLIFGHCVYAQTDIAGFDQYNSYELCIYIDNIEQRYIPKILLELYYSNININDFVREYQEIDCENQKRNVYKYTKKAKDGYLIINETLSDKIKECCANCSKVQISYVYNGKIVSTKDEVRQILKLRAKKIQILSVEQDGNTKVITINFSDKIWKLFI
jgi:uncharacterized protein involved in tolerance to divalent cations